MRKMLMAVMVALAVLSGVSYAAEKPAPTPAQVQEAIGRHKLIDGMTLAEANRAMPARPRMIRSGGAIIGATWRYQAGTADNSRRTGHRRGQQNPDGSAVTFIVWSAGLDENGILYGVTQRSETDTPSRR